MLLAERDRIGGDCTWTGCVPSKSLIRVAKAAHEIRTAHRFGVGAASCTVDMATVRDYVQRKVQDIYQPTSPDALEREGIDVALGRATFESPRRCESESGRRWATLPGLHRRDTRDAANPGLDETPHRTYHNIFDCRTCPRR